MECLGLYFVAFLRDRKGISNAVPMMGRVFELTGQGETYEQAFKHTYGISVKQAVSEVVDLFRRTSTNPVERVKGTQLETFLPR